ncbi:hypothetical protein BaRGS_00009953 [Batillaria attramentaria]|uniref:Uncharacterized protein n=1 Tax=Batillaria attramentaria TaxID=370345 RepID=A0ABD0LHY1_9CAEN
MSVSVDSEAECENACNSLGVADRTLISGSAEMGSGGRVGSIGVSESDGGKVKILHFTAFVKFHAEKALAGPFCLDLTANLMALVLNCDTPNVLALWCLVRH